MRRPSRTFATYVVTLQGMVLVLLTLITLLGPVIPRQHLSAAQPGPVSQAFVQAARESGVPVSILKAICYMEGRFSNHGGSPSMDNGFGCMHLVDNSRSDTLVRAASELKVSISRLKTDLATNIRGGARLLRDSAVQLSLTPRLPTRLGDWYGAVAQYSNAPTRSTALMYADGVYALLRQGFAAQADDGETIVQPSQPIQPDTVTAAGVKDTETELLPRGCTRNGQVDYQGAINCILPSKTFDCNKVKKNKPCNYEGANRPLDYAINLIVIHDVEGTAQEALNVFQNPGDEASAHYVVDSDGTVYQVVGEKDITYHGGNYWYNQHSIGIEHAGYDAAGYRWYNATEYLASAKLVAYLLQKYSIPLDHAHIISHGTIPSPSATSLPNHVDPGPYWLWDYYLKLIHSQGVPFPDGSSQGNILTLRPRGDRRPFGAHGTETGANSNFVYLYKGPSTGSGLIPQPGSSADITSVTTSVEADLSYYYLARVRDQRGSGDTMYKIWYGVEAPGQSRFAHAQLVWLAVPPGAASKGQGTLVRLTAPKGQDPLIYGRPPEDAAGPQVKQISPDSSGTTVKSSSYTLGNAPRGAIFVSAYTYTVSKGNTQVLWYEINYNHRQAWVPASEVTLVNPTPVAQP